MLVYEERHESFRDIDLFALVALLEYFIEHGKIDADLATVVSSWKSACVRSGPGTIIFDFSELDADPELMKQLRLALGCTEAEVERIWTPTIPGAVLSRYDPDDITFKDFPVERMIAAIRGLRRVIDASRPGDRAS